MSGRTRSEYEEFLYISSVEKLEDIIRALGTLQSDFGNAGMINESYGAMAVVSKAIEFKDRLTGETG